MEQLLKLKNKNLTSNTITNGILKAIAIIIGVCLLLYFLYEVQSILVYIAISVVIALIVAIIANLNNITLVPKDTKTMFLRCLSGLIAMILYFSALARIPIGQAVTLQYTAPLFVALLSGRIIREKVSPSIFILLILSFFGIILATLLAIGGKYIFSLPFLFVILSGLKIKGLTALQMFQLWRLIQHLKNSGRFSQGQFGQSQGSSSVTNDEAYKLLGLKKGCSKEEVLKVANQLQKKIHPDMNRDVKTERLSQLVNEAKEKIIKTDFS